MYYICPSVLKLDSSFHYNLSGGHLLFLSRYLLVVSSIVSPGCSSGGNVGTCRGGCGCSGCLGCGASVGGFATGSRLSTSNVQHVELPTVNGDMAQPSICVVHHCSLLPQLMVVYEVVDNLRLTLVPFTICDLHSSNNHYELCNIFIFLVSLSCLSDNNTWDNRITSRTSGMVTDARFLCMMATNENNQCVNATCLGPIWTLPV